MKLQFTDFIELVVHHKDAVLTEFPSRFCVIRIPLEKLRYKACNPISLGQIKKLKSIGFYEDPWSYVFEGHRSYDKAVLIEKHLNNLNWIDYAHCARDVYKNYFDFIGASDYVKNSI